MLERQIERRLKDRVKEIGGMALKFISGVRGVPDRLIFLPGGQLVLVELKKPGGKLRPLQERMRKKFIKLGFKYYVVDSYESLEEMLSAISST